MNVPEIRHRLVLQSIGRTIAVGRSVIGLSGTGLSDNCFFEEYDEFLGNEKVCLLGLRAMRGHMVFNSANCTNVK